jgi:hypothetical protein
MAIWREKENFTPKLSDFSLLITSKILDSCFRRRNDDYRPMNEKCHSRKNGNPEGFIFKNILRIAQFRLQFFV